MKRKLYRPGDDSAEWYTLSWTERDHPAVGGLYQTSSDVYKYKFGFGRSGHLACQRPDIDGSETGQIMY